jgi:phytoene dehydrogenase-like protein
VLWERLMQPFLLAALNTEPEAGSADLAGAVVRETLARGGRAYRPRIAHPTLAEAFVAPAVETLRQAGVEVRLGRRLKRIAYADGRAAALEFADRTVELGPDDEVVLATPPWVARELVPELTAPDEFRAIVNAHYRIVPPEGAPAMVGVVGGVAEWVFAFPDRLSVTVSGADRLVDRDREELARLLWKDVAAVHGLSDALPPWQIVKEKRATFAATPAQDALRPHARTAFANLVLAGDWTQTGLPATIEGALRSGATAAALIQGR